MPGPVWTPLTGSDGTPAEMASSGSDTSLERPARPDEIAPAGAYFASNADASFVTREVLTLPGGETIAG